MAVQQLPEPNWREHFSATRDLLKLMAKEREIVEANSLESSGQLSEDLSGTSTTSGSYSPCSPPPAPSGSPASDCPPQPPYTYTSCDNLLTNMDHRTYRTGPVPNGLGSRDAYLDSPGHYPAPTRMARMPQPNYNSEGESTEPTMSEVSTMWDQHTGDYMDNTYKDLSTIPSMRECRTLTSVSGLSVEGPLHSTLLNNTQGYSTVSSLYLEDVHRAEIKRQMYNAKVGSRMNPVGEEGEYEAAKAKARRPGPTVGESQQCGGHTHNCCHQREVPNAYHHHHHHHHHQQSMNHYDEVSHQPSMLAYSLAAHQGSAPSTPLPRPQMPLPQQQQQPQPHPQLPQGHKHVTFNSHARVEIFQKASFEASDTSAEQVQAKKDKASSRKVPGIKKPKKSFKFFKCCTSANKTYSSLPEKDLPKDISVCEPQIDYSKTKGMKTDERLSGHVYETMLERRPPCVGKEATPLAPKSRPLSYFNSPCCGNQDCNGPMPPYSSHSDSIPVDSDASTFMRNGLVRGGVAGPDRGRMSNRWSGADNLGAQFKTLALV